MPERPPDDPAGDGAADPPPPLPRPGDAPGVSGGELGGGAQRGSRHRGRDAPHARRVRHLVRPGCARPLAHQFPRRLAEPGGERDRRKLIGGPRGTPKEPDRMAVMKTSREVRGVGLAIPRPDGPDKVTGQTQYVADIKPKGMLYAKLLRSPHAHARVVRIDTAAANLPGVRAVLIAADIPEIKRKAP